MKKSLLFQATVLVLMIGLGACRNVENPPSEQASLVEESYSATQSGSEVPKNEESTRIIQLPSLGSYYHGIFPGGTNEPESFLPPENLTSYEENVGKTAAWVYFSNNWFEGRDFPLETATWVREKGSVPYIRIMMWSEWVQGHADPLFTHQAIIAGDFDADFHAWCATAHDFGTSLLVEFGVEVNGDWFPWNGVYSGGGTTNGYGEPDFPDGPERFRDAYRHIIQICRDEDVLNITWVFHVNDGDWPQEEWNRFENYYPGDDWIDWLGLSVYGVQTPDDAWWNAFTPVVDEFYPRLTSLAPDKPIIIAEFGCTAGNPNVDQAQWARDALNSILSDRWPRIIGFSWWNEAWQNDDNPAHDSNMRVQDNPDLAQVFLELVGDNTKVLGRLQFK
jgi:hypothetical protein